MKRAFAYKDEKSDKFWNIDYSGTDFAVNYGKAGAIGKYEVKTFDTAAQCIKNAESLIKKKLKKGYTEIFDFDYGSHIFLDDEETGPHPKTSHPKFTEHFTEDFYYDCGEEYAPFGSDEGSDTLYAITLEIRKKPKLDFYKFPKILIENDWGMKYYPADSVDENFIKNMSGEEEMNVVQSDMVTYAAAFAQIKMTGKIDERLKLRAINAMKRFKLCCQRTDGNFDGGITDKMAEDLQTFEGEYK